MVPRWIKGLDRARVVAVAAGELHSMALTADGKVYTWGYGYSGQLGPNDQSHRLVPTEVATLGGVSALACGSCHSMAVRRGEGSLFVWGYGGDGELGLGDRNDRLVPTVVPNLQGVVTIAAGVDHSLSLDMDGTVMAWGRNSSGQLGLGDTEERLSPTVVEGLRHVLDIAGGEAYSISVTLEGHLCKWGNDVTEPTRVAMDGLDGAGVVARVAAGYGHSMAVTTTGRRRPR